MLFGLATTSKQATFDAAAESSSEAGFSETEAEMEVNWFSESIPHVNYVWIRAVFGETLLIT